MAARRNAAIIGAGPAGLAAAYRLTQRGWRPEVFEASSGVGGLARSITLWGQTVDVAPHIFAGGDTEALALWSHCAGSDGARLSLRRGIVMGAVVLEYPLQAGDLVRKLSPRSLLACAVGGVGARLLPKKATQVDSAEAWIVARYGRALYDALVRSYIEKLWGMPGGGVDSSFVRALFGVPPRGRTHQAKRSMPRQTKVVEQTFTYPRQGASAVWTHLARAVREGGGIRFDAPVEEILVDRRGVRGLRVDGEIHAFGDIISTMPVTRLVGSLSDAPNDVRAAARTLRARHAVVVHLLVHGAPRSPYLWLYAYDPRLRVGRVSDHRSWHPELPTDAAAIVTMEYWCGDEDEIWTLADGPMVALASAELDALGVFRPGGVADGRVTRLRGALPVPDVGFAARLEIVTHHIRTIAGLDTIGRQGGFAFSSMADVMAEGTRAADRVVDGAGKAAY